LSLIKDKIKVAADLKYKYYSLLSLTSFSVVSLIGFKFPLDKKKIFRGETLCVSNELRESAGEIKVFKGKIILIRSTD
jgi:thiamine pyrophosphokinase